MKVQRLPSSLRKTLTLGGDVHTTKNTLRQHGLQTVCESARCPNISECFSMKRATFLIMGPACTRTCRFCSVDKGTPRAPDKDEPLMVAHAVRDLGITHAVITSVTRDDLADGGADHFFVTARTVRRQNPGVSLELLTPDFKGDEKALLHLIEADFDLFNHNVETVPSLYRKVRPQADYGRSLEVLRFVKQHKNITVKSGLMVGIGETTGEVKTVLADLKAAGCDVVTIGQYLMPTLKNMPVYEYVQEDVYKEYERFGQEIGIRHVYAGPFIRSSYHAQEVMDRL